MEKPFNGLCYQSTSIKQVETRQLRLHSSHCRLTHKDSLLETGLDHFQCTQACRDYHRRDNMSRRPPGLNRHQ